VDPILRTLEVLAGRSGDFPPVAAHRNGALVRAEPFAAIEIDLAELWAP